MFVVGMIKKRMLHLNEAEWYNMLHCSHVEPPVLLLCIMCKSLMIDVCVISFTLIDAEKMVIKTSAMGIVILCQSLGTDVFSVHPILLLALCVILLQVLGAF